MNSCGVSDKTLDGVRRAQLELRGAFRDSLRVGVRLGHLLNDAKNECRHGEWDVWLRKHYEGTSRHARRLMSIARKYREPDDVPAMSLREAMRAIAGGESRAERRLSQDRLSRGTASEILTAASELAELVGTNLVVPLELEGCTAKHPAMQKAKAIASAIRRLLEHAKIDAAAFSGVAVSE